MIYILSYFLEHIFISIIILLFIIIKTKLLMHLWQLIQGYEKSKVQKKSKAKLRNTNETWTETERPNIKCNKPMNRRAEKGQILVGRGSEGGEGRCGVECNGCRGVRVASAWHGMAWKYGVLWHWVASVTDQQLRGHCSWKWKRMSSI